MGYLLIFLVNTIYIPAIWYGFISDDDSSMKLHPYNVKRSRKFSIVLHLMVSEFIYIAFGVNFISLMAALMFALHPMAIQVPVWRAAKAYGCNALLLLMIIAFSPFSFPLYFLSSLAIATTIFTPLIFIFTDYWFLAFLCPILIFLAYKPIMDNIRNKIKGDGIFTQKLPDDFTLHKFKPNKLIIMVKTFGYYFLASLLPLKNGFYNSFLVTMGVSKKQNDYWFSLNRHFWGGIIVIILLICLWWQNRFNFIGMGIMIFVLSIIPFLNIVTVQQLTAPRYAYLPLIGFQIALVNILAKYDMVGFAIACILLGVYITQTFRVREIYKKNSLDAIIKDSHEFPDNPRLWYFRYEHALHRQNPVVAWSEANWGLKYLPYDGQLWFGLACASFELGDLNATEDFLKQAEKFMLIVGREDMQNCIDELRKRIKLKLEGKYLK